MKAPINCPLCGDPLINDQKPIQNVYTKECRRRLSHILEIDYDGETDEVVNVILTYDRTNKSQVFWFYRFKEVTVVSNANDDGGNDLRLPWFEPDLSNLKKLIQKIKIYILFS